MTCMTKIINRVFSKSRKLNSKLCARFNLQLFSCMSFAGLVHIIIGNVEKKLHKIKYLIDIYFITLKNSFFKTNLMCP